MKQNSNIGFKYFKSLSLQKSKKATKDNADKISKGCAIVGDIGIPPNEEFVSIGIAIKKKNMLM